MTDNPKVIAVKALNRRYATSFEVYGDSRDVANSLRTDQNKMFEDIQGFPYQAVRFCDLDLIRDK
jgi:hypothetical protein